MKLTKLLVLSMLTLFGVSSAKAVDGNVWQKPAAAAMELDVEYYFYNVGSELFFTQGNAWGTQASVGKEGLRVKIAESSAGIYTLTDYVKTQSAWKMWWFIDSTTDPTMYVDYNNQANFLWTITDMGNNVYRFSPSTTNPFTGFAEGMYVGLNRTAEGAADRTYLTWDNTAESGAFIDWQLFNADAYDIYNVAMQLKEVLDRAEELGLDVAAQVAVYNNTSSTIEELQDALKTASELVEEREKELKDNDIINATGENPKDASIWITNGTFDTIGDFTGWSGSKFGAGGTTSTCAERYNMNYDTYQDITVKYPGLYLFGVKGFYRAGSSDKSYQLYMANDPQATLAKYYVSVDGHESSLQISSIWEGAQKEKPAHGKAMESNGMWIPNTMADANEFFHTDGLYSHLLPVEIEGSNVTVRIGVKKDTKIDDNDWSIFDDFTLLFCNNGEDRYVSYVKMKAESYPTYENAVATQSYLDAYLALKSNPVGSPADKALAYIENLDAAKAELIENISLWNQWENLVKTAENAIETYADLEDEEYVDLMIYADPTEPETDVKTIRAARSLNNEELKAEIAKLKALIAAVEEAAKNQIHEGDDVTKFLTNPKFEEQFTGWKNTTGVALGGTTDNQTAEAWNKSSFDIYQEVEKAPVGVYEISVQGFYRYGRGDDAWKHYNAKDADEVKNAPVYVYLNDIKTSFKNVYDEVGHDQEYFIDMTEKNEDGTPQANETGKYIFKGIPYGVQEIPDTDPIMYYPNGMASAAVCFSDGLYTQTAAGLVAKKGDTMRIGVKGSTNQLGDSWVIFDNFKLTYKGFAIEFVKPVLEENIAKYEPLLDKVFAKDQKALLRTALEEAKAALEYTDGKAMFEKLAALVAIDVDASVKKFEDFQQALVDFETAYANADAAGEDSRPSQATLDEALALVGRAQTIVDNEDFTDAELDELLAEMEAMTKKLGIPAAMDTAADETPANATYMITNPTYTDNSTSGWTRENATGNYGAEYTVCENYNGKFDIFQDLEDMYEGTYELSVQAFYRNGSAVNDYKTFIEDATANNNAYIYVGIGDGKITAKVPRLASIAKSFTSTSKDDNGNFKSEDNYAWVVEQADLEVDADSTMATGLQVPNMRIVVNSFFEDEVANGTSALKASIIFKVGADGKARIGVAKNEEVGNDWTAWDNWKLTYYGKNSSKEPGVIDGVKDASTVADVVKTEVFTLSGARVKSGKGVAIVRQTLSNGTVRVKKVMVK